MGVPLFESSISSESYQSGSLHEGRGLTVNLWLRMTDVSNTYTNQNDHWILNEYSCFSKLRVTAEDVRYVHATQGSPQEVKDIAEPPTVDLAACENPHHSL